MDYVLKASAVIVLFYLCFYFFLKKETFFTANRWFLIIGIIGAIVFPFVEIPIEIISEPTLISEPSFIIDETLPQQNTQTAIETPLDWTYLISVTYGLGILVFLIQFLLQFGSLVLLLLKNPKNEQGIYTYVIIKNKVAPFSFFKWIFYNPESYSDEELKLMLNHEKVHAKQLHSIDLIITQLACVVFWANPLIWLYRKEVRQNLEYIADQNTQDQTKAQKEYQLLLLKTSVANHHISLSTPFYNSLIKERIIMLNKSRSNQKKQWRFVLIVPLLAGLLMSMNTKTVYVEAQQEVDTITNTISFIVHKNTTDQELKAMSKSVKEQGGSLKFSQLKRNDANELTSIFVKLYGYSYGGGDSERPIQPFLIYKELFAYKGGYVGDTNGATLHFEDPSTGKRQQAVKALKQRVSKILITNGLVNTDAVNLSEQRLDIKIVFKNTMTDDDLKDIKTELKANDIVMDIKTIKRNKDGIITAIDVDFKTENGSANYTIKHPEGIQPFYFKRNQGSFGVGAAKHQDYIVETIRIDDLNKQTSDSDKSYNLTYQINDSVVVAVSDTIRVKRFNDYYNKTKRKLNSKDQNNLKDTIYFGIDSAEVKRLSQLKSDIYYEDATAPNVINSETTNIFQPNDKTYQGISSYSTKNPKPLYIINGEVVGAAYIHILNPNDIDKVSILKGETAVKTYGKKGENGVIIIDLKNRATTTEKGEKNPWSIRTEVSNVTYIDDEDDTKNGTLAYLTKYTPDNVLDQHIAYLEKFDIKVKFSKLKRDKKGEITSIKVTVYNSEGDESSASFKNNKGIPSIEFGKSEGKLVARSSTMN